MIHKEAWYREALEQEFQRGREHLPEDADLEGNLVEDALRSWRMSKPSELEERVLEDPARYFPLLMQVAQGAGTIPFLFTGPQPLRELDDEKIEGVLDLAFFLFPSHPGVREWLASLVSRKWVFGTYYAPILVRRALQIVEEDPQVLLTVIDSDDWYDSVWDQIDLDLKKEVFKALMRVAEATKDPRALSWLWDSGTYEYYSDEGEPPDLSWEAVLATPEDSLPYIDYQVRYHDRAGDSDWGHSDGDGEEVPLNQFARLYLAWDSFGWDKERAYDPWYLTTGEQYGEVENEEGEMETSATAVTISFSDTSETMITWLRDHWPPPNTVEESPS